MNTYFFRPENRRHWGDSATRPIEPPWGALAALLLLAGISPQRCRALPAHPMTTHSGAFNSGF